MRSTLSNPLTPCFVNSCVQLYRLCSPIVVLRMIHSSCPKGYACQSCRSKCTRFMSRLRPKWSPFFMSTHKRLVVTCFQFVTSKYGAFVFKNSKHNCKLSFRKGCVVHCSRVQISWRKARRIQCGRGLKPLPPREPWEFAKYSRQSSPAAASIRLISTSFCGFQRYPCPLEA